MKKRIYKVLSVLLAVIMIFSAFSCVLSTVSAATEKTYYVNGGAGDDAKNGATRANAIKTVAKAVELANAAGLTAGDTVTVSLLGSTAAKWIASGSKMPAHDFKLVVTSNSTSSPSTVGEGTDIVMGGETELKAVNVYFGSSYKYFAAGGNSISFAAGAAYSGNQGMSGFVIGSTEAVASYSGSDINVNASMPINDFGLSNRTGDTTFNNKINVTYTALDGDPVFHLSSTDGTTTYKNAVNVKIKSANSVSFDKAAKAKFDGDGYLQVLNISTNAIPASQFADIDSSKAWVINNSTHSNDLIDFTATKGVFKVDATNYSNVKAVNAADPDNTVAPVGDTLTLPAGVWTITADKIPSKATYYVKANGGGDGSSEDNPIGTVGGAISQAIANGYGAGDEVTIKVVGAEAVEFGTMPAEYKFKLIVTSNVAASGTVGKGTYVSLGGETLFTNVKIDFGASYQIFQANGQNLTFGEGAIYGGNAVQSTFTIGKSSGANIYNNDFTINTLIPIRNFYLGADYGAPQYNGVVTINYNSASQAPSFRLGTFNGSTTYNNGLNINMLSAAGFSFRDADKFILGDNGYVQIINSTPLSANVKDLGIANENASAEKMWILNNNTGNNKTVEFTDTKGKFKVNLANPDHELIATNIATGEETKYDGTSGYITLPAGDYNLRILRDPIYKSYYVDDATGVEVAPGTRPADVGTKKKPVKTVADASRLIASDGLSDLDVATIYLPSNEISYLGSGSEATKAWVVIDATGEENATLYTDPEGGGMSLFANTTFSNVYFQILYKWGEFILNEHSFTLEADATVNAPKTYFWAIAYAKKRADDMTVTIRGKWLSSALYVYSAYQDHTCTGTYNVIWDSPDSPFGISLGNEGTGRQANKENVYAGNINLTIKRAQAFSINTSGLGFTMPGSLNVIVDDAVALPYDTKQLFNDVNAEGGKWFITNVAKDDEFVSFGSEKGKFDIKKKATAYSRLGEEAVVKHTGGTVDLSAKSGSYVISDKKDITPIIDNPNKMLYYKLGGGHKHIAQWCTLYDEETYVFEYTLFSQSYVLTKPLVVQENRYSVLENEPEIISDKVIHDNFHRVVCEFTIPKGINEKWGSSLFVGLSLPSQDEGLIMDRTVYKKGDPDKTDIFQYGNKFHKGLDYITLNYEFWGKVFSGSSGGTGKTYWTDGYQELRVMDKDYDYAAYLLYLNNPQDGEWWKKGDVVEEKQYQTYAHAKGTFTDQNGNGVKGTKFLLVSEDKTYSATSGSNGKFDFGKILTGFYDLFIANGSERIETGFSSYIGADDLIIFNVKTDTSGLIVADDTGEDYVDDETTDEEEDITPTSSFSGTVFTPQLEKVPNLTVGLSGEGLEGKVEAVTDENGAFGFADIPVGEYEVYAVNSDGSKYTFRTVSIREGIDLNVKLKYEPSVASNAEEEGSNGWIIWVIIAAVVALIAVAVLVYFLVIKKKKADAAPSAE